MRTWHLGATLALVAAAAACGPRTANVASDGGDAGASETACVSCHLAEYRKAPEHLGKKPTTCDECHLQSGWHDWHPEEWGKGPNGAADAAAIASDPSTTDETDSDAAAGEIDVPDAAVMVDAGADASAPPPRKPKPKPKPLPPKPPDVISHPSRRVHEGPQL